MRLRMGRSVRYIWKDVKTLLLIVYWLSRSCYGLLNSFGSDVMYLVRSLMVEGCVGYETGSCLIDIVFVHCYLFL
ncbi:hypothetical protein G7K_2804-t1 [Saitoella complicata NRRL Y-17804]|uniref:Uncharacterized protein n=1 Tax=Saitoella complicata (strain BCRC 22490 / CBS 7301 / JCM 7358 / NBRC 10748 / NRRL Y-17804) TaxID=698492 RepID=A0A0E9NFL7_SAICN|nr:hypothetical protein G7K_2804-t1 [Saitoella complicata NRRL Y-17804]